MVASNLLKITQNPAFELLDVPKSSLHHDGAGLFTSYTAGAKHHDGFILHGLWKAFDGFWEGTEGANIEVDGVLKRSHPQFVVVSSIEHVDGLALVKHRLEGLWFNFGTRGVRRADVVQAHRDDFGFLPYVHPVKRLILRE